MFKVDVYSYIYIYTCIYIQHIYIYLHTYIYIYIYICLHLYIAILFPVCSFFFSALKGDFSDELSTLASNKSESQPMQEVVGIWETAIRLLLGCPGQEVRING